MTVSSNHKGFTLLEVLVSIAIFSMLAIISYTTLDTYIDQRERLTEHYGKLERLQRVFILLERDIQFMVNRKRRNGSDIEAAILSKNQDMLLTLTVTQPDFDNQTGASLKRVQWRLEDKEMVRASWQILDHDGQVEPSEFVVSDEVDKIELDYLYYDKSQGIDKTSSLKDDAFPDGIEINLWLESGEQYRRVFSIAGVK